MGLIKADKKERYIAMLVILISIALVFVSTRLGPLNAMLACIPAIPLIIISGLMLLGVKFAVIWLRVFAFPLCCIGVPILLLAILWCGLSILCHHLPHSSRVHFLLVAIALSSLSIPFILSIKWKLSSTVIEGKKALHYILAILTVIILYTPINGLVYFYWLYNSSYYSVAEIPKKNEWWLESRSSTLDEDVKISIIRKGRIILTRQKLFDEFTESGWTSLEYHHSNDGQLIIFTKDRWNAPKSPLCAYNLEDGKFYSISIATMNKEGIFIKSHPDCVITREALHDMVVKHGGLGAKITFHQPDPIKFALKYFSRPCFDTWF